MKRILLYGAGRSSSVLLEYLHKKSAQEGWSICLVSNSLDLVKKVLPKGCGFELKEGDVLNEEELELNVKSSDIVVSMLPASLHILIAKVCLRYGKNLITASYVSKEMEALGDEVEQKGLLFLNECGLDPGLDHMSAKKIIDEIISEGGELIGFESFTGGLVAPECDNNPWNYKFTWNPRNVVLAGQGGAAKFIQEGTYKYIPYQKLFRRTEIIEVEGYGKFEGYANRDSLSYRKLYNLEGIKTLYRGTLRRPGFCKAWDLLIQLGMTDDSYVIDNSEHMTYREFTNLFLAYNPTDSVEIKLQRYLRISQDDFDLWEKIKSIGLFENTKVGIPKATPAQILQKILEEKWSLAPDDKDMIVMWHKFTYEINGEKKEIQSSLVVKGQDQIKTSMAITVGLPIAIALKKVLNGEIKEKGVRIPVEPEIYLPILEELEQDFNIKFIEKKIK